VEQAAVTWLSANIGL